MHYSPPDSSVLEILQGRILEGIAIFFSRGLSDPGMESLSPALQADFSLSHREAKLTGCHRFLFQFVVHPGMGTGLPYISVCVSYSVISDSLQPLGLYSLPGSSVHRILQARILEWVAISFSRVSSQPRIEPGSHAFHADALPSELLVIKLVPFIPIAGPLQIHLPSTSSVSPQRTQRGLLTVFSVVGLLHQRVHQETLRSFHFPEFYAKTNHKSPILWDSCKPWSFYMWIHGRAFSSTWTCTHKHIHTGTELILRDLLQPKLFLTNWESGREMLKV